MIPTPPLIFDKRSCNFSLSKSDLVDSICFFIISTLLIISSELPNPLIIVVVLLSIIIFSVVPHNSSVASSNLYPLCSDITVPPVNTAISSKISRLPSPNPGTLT